METVESGRDFRKSERIVAENKKPAVSRSGIMKFSKYTYLFSLALWQTTSIEKLNANAKAAASQ